MNMSSVLVIGDEKALAKAIEKHGAENVWWAEGEGPATRPAAIRAGLARYHFAGADANQEEYTTVIGGTPAKVSKPAASKKKATVKKDD